MLPVGDEVYPESNVGILVTYLITDFYGPLKNQICFMSLIILRKIFKLYILLTLGY